MKTKLFSVVIAVLVTLSSTHAVADNLAACTITSNDVETVIYVEKFEGQLGGNQQHLKIIFQKNGIFYNISEILDGSGIVGLAASTAAGGGIIYGPWTFSRLPVSLVDAENSVSITCECLKKIKRF